MKQIIASVLALLTAQGALAASPPAYFESAGITQAQGITRGAGVRIAVLNTGVNYHLPEFYGRLEKNEDGTYGYDATGEGSDALDSGNFGLGTEVTSVIAGNELGIAPEATVLPIKVFGENGNGGLDFIARGLHRAVEKGARIISLGAGPLSSMLGSPVTCAEFQRAAAEGVLVMVSAGNDGRALSHVQDACPIKTLVVVAGIDAKGDLAIYSNYGFPDVHVAAPSEYIRARSRNGQVIETGRGTSYAVAVATGVAALVWSAHPEYSALEVKNALIRGAEPSPALAEKVLANGPLNAARAIAAPVSLR